MVNQLIIVAIVASVALSFSTKETSDNLPQLGCYGEMCPSDVAKKLLSFRSMFEEFKKRYQKKYSSKEEEMTRYMIFMVNMKKAKKLSEKNPNAAFGATPYADLSESEFKAYHRGDEYYAQRQRDVQTASTKNSFIPTFTASELTRSPSSMDWRTKGAVTPIKNQGQCGSCWSFSTTGGIEGQWFLAGNKLTSISEQFFVSCDTLDSGCQGGLMNNAYEWVLSTHDGNIPTESSYPYVSGGGSVPACQQSKGTFGAKIKGHYNIFHSEEQMRGFVGSKGPLSIAVDASAWQFYMGGLMSNCGGSRLDHGVLIVGYSMTGGSYNKPYWIIKNSWGESWGEQGYIYVSYGSDQCLLSHYPVTSIVNGTAPPPKPPPSGTFFSHTVYDDQKCSRGAQTFTWGEGDCVSWDGVSFTAQCSSNKLLVTAYPKSVNCTGSTASVTEALDTCTQDQGDFCYYRNRCHATARASTVQSKRASDHFKSLLKRSL